MQRNRLLSILTAVLLTAVPAHAESAADQIARQLRSQGFGNVTITQTWLGRARITGTSPSGKREIVVNPGTGEILRDLFTQTGNAGKTSTVIGATGSRDNGGSDSDSDGASGSGGGTDDDNGSDDNSGSDDGGSDDGGSDDGGSDDGGSDDGGSDDSGSDDSGSDDSGSDDTDD